MSEISTTRQVLDALIPELQSEGYSVFIEPSRDLLPPEMKGYTPDAIALGNDRKLAIEIALDEKSSIAKKGNLTKQFKKIPGWEILFYYARPSTSEGDVPGVSTTLIDRSTVLVKKLVGDKEYQAALLMAWATLEATGRLVSPEKFKRPQTPGRLIEVLAAEGSLTPDEADLLRGLSKQRNQLVHGGLDAATPTTTSTSAMRFSVRW